MPWEIFPFQPHSQVQRRRFTLAFKKSPPWPWYGGDTYRERKISAVICWYATVAAGLSFPTLQVVRKFTTPYSPYLREITMFVILSHPLSAAGSLSLCLTTLLFSDLKHSKLIPSLQFLWSLPRPCFNSPADRVLP